MPQMPPTIGDDSPIIINIINSSIINISIIIINIEDTYLSSTIGVSVLKFLLCGIGLAVWFAMRKRLLNKDPFA